MVTPAAQAENWQTPALQGALAALFGLVLLVWPAFALATLKVLIVIFGAYALIDGILAIVAAIRGIRQGTEWWPHLLEGILGIAVAALVFIWTSITVEALLYVIAAWAILTGIFKLVPAITQREWLLAIGGLASIIFGAVLAAYAGAGLETLVFIIGTYAMVLGILLLGQALQLMSRPTA